MGQGSRIVIPSFEPPSEEEEMLREVLEEPRVLPGYMDPAVQRAKAQILADEDQRIFDVLDALAAAPVVATPAHAACSHRNHKAFLRPIEECGEPECAIRQVVEE